MRLRLPAPYRPGFDGVGELRIGLQWRRVRRLRLRARRMSPTQLRGTLCKYGSGRIPIDLCAAARSAFGVEVSDLCQNSAALPADAPTRAAYN